MQRMSRRSMFKSGLVGAAALSWAGAARGERVEAVQITGTILFVGNRPELLPPDGGERSAESFSVLCSLDLASGEQTAHAVPLPHAMSVVGLGDGRKICVGQGESCFVSHRTGTPDRILAAPEGYMFTGCMWVDQNERNLTLGLARKEPFEEAGMIWRVSLDDYGTVRTGSSGGKWPVAFDHRPASDELVVLNAGEAAGRSFTREGLMYRPTFCSLAVVDVDTLRPMRQIAVESAMGRPSTLLVLPDCRAMVGAAQFQRLPASNDDGRLPALAARMSYSMLFDGFAPVPQPLLSVGFAGPSESAQMLAMECEHEALAFNESTNTAVATFSNSDRVLFVEPGGRPTLVDACDFGLTNVAGACSLKGTRCVALAGRNRYVAIVDCSTKAVVRRYRTENFGANRLAYRGSA